MAGSPDQYAADARRFVEIQREAHNAMLTGQSRLQRACSVPVIPSPTNGRQLPNLTQLRTELTAEAASFQVAANNRRKVAESAQTRRCRNPVSAVLELFGTQTECTDAKADTIARRRIVKAADDWSELLMSQLKVLDDARALERRGCLSAGFTTKLTEAYRDSLQPAGVPLRVLFDQWTSED